MAMEGKIAAKARLTGKFGRWRWKGCCRKVGREGMGTPTVGR